MWSKREAGNLSPSNAEIRNKQSCISLSRMRHHREKGQLYFKIVKGCVEGAALNISGIPEALQNRAKLNLIVKTVKNC